MTRRWTTLALALVLLTVGSAWAKTSWVSVKNVAGGDELCLRSGGNDIYYHALSAGDEARCRVSGPRRLKIVSRYLFTTDDAERVPYTLSIRVDGQEVLRKAFTGKPFENVSLCADPGNVGSLRRAYVDLPAGHHQVSVSAETTGGGRVALRIFRQVKRKRDRWMALSPESYSSMRHLEFASGTQSSYYHFDATTPLRFEVHGPTTLRVRTRLDFDHTMNGSQTYAVEVLIDGISWRTFHFDTTKLSSARWLESPDTLPGTRNELRIDVDRGTHTVEIHCVRPEACGVAAMIHIPESDLER